MRAVDGVVRCAVFVKVNDPASVYLSNMPYRFAVPFNVHAAVAFRKVNEGFAEMRVGQRVQQNISAAG